jgi:hypothetical protein
VHIHGLPKVFTQDSPKERRQQLRQIEEHLNHPKPDDNVDSWKMNFYALQAKYYGDCAHA